MPVASSRRLDGVTGRGRIADSAHKPPPLRFCPSTHGYCGLGCSVAEGSINEGSCDARSLLAEEDACAGLVEAEQETQLVPAEVAIDAAVAADTAGAAGVAEPAATTVSAAGAEEAIPPEVVATPTRRGRGFYLKPRARPSPRDPG